MARRGRKRKNGHRVFDRSHPSGRLHKPEPVGPLVPEETMAHRSDMVGRVDAMTAEAGRAASILLKWGIITDQQRLAAERYRATYHRYRRTQGMPNRHEKGAYFPVAPTPDEQLTREQSRRAAEWAMLTPEEQGLAQLQEAIEARHAWMAVCGAIRGLHPVALVRGVVDMVCIDDVAPETWSAGIVAPAAVRALCQGLDALVRHFNISHERSRSAAA
ncbi:MAG: hypothetical protein F8N39_07235 [Clostridiaceae bacterium]|nr:hypothetical protein [Clostridiaceae bacterium]